MKSKTQKPTSRIQPRPGPLDDWEQGWLAHWGKAGTRGYELPKTGPAAEEAAFTEVRSPEKEIARLERIHQEFIKGFRELYHLGPAYYQLAREVGKELAKAGVATLWSRWPWVSRTASSLDLGRTGGRFKASYFFPP